jgi:hypothetical protein
MDADVVLSLAVQEAKELEQTFKAANFHTELARGDFGDPIPALLKLSDSFDNRVDAAAGSALDRALVRRLGQQYGRDALQLIERLLAS